MATTTKKPPAAQAGAVESADAPTEATTAASARAKFKAAASEHVVKLTERLDFPELGVAVEVHPMMGPSSARLFVDGYKQEIRKQKDGTLKQELRVIAAEYFPIVVQECTHGLDGRKLWRADEMDEVRALPPAVFDRLLEAGMRVSGLTKEAQDALGEGSGETEIAGSTSSSPSA